MNSLVWPFFSFIVSLVELPSIEKPSSYSVTLWPRPGEAVRGSFEAIRLCNLQRSASSETPEKKGKRRLRIKQFSFYRMTRLEKLVYWVSFGLFLSSAVLSSWPIQYWDSGWGCSLTWLLFCWCPQAWYNFIPSATLPSSTKLTSWIHEHNTRHKP